MARIIYGGAAVGDFERIIEFTLQSSPDSGSRALERIRTAIEILAAHPLIGRRVDGDLRELVISEGATGYVAVLWFRSCPGSGPHPSHPASTRGRIPAVIRPTTER